MSLSQAGSMRFILIGVLIILIALVGAGAWFGYSAFKIPSPEPAASPVAVRSKIPASPAPMKVPQPQKIEAPKPEPQPATQETREDAPDRTVAASVAPVATVTVSNPASKQDTPPVEAPKPSAAMAAKEPDKGPGSELEISKARNDQVQEAQSMQPASPQTAPVPVMAEEKTAPAPPAPASPASESEAAEPAKTAPEAVVALPAEQKKSAPEPAATKPGPAPKSVTAEAETQKPAPFTIQVGAYLTKAYAEEKQADLEQRGYEPFIFQTRDKKQRTWYLVRVGHFEDRPAAEMFLSEFTARENIPAVIALSKRR